MDVLDRAFRTFYSSHLKPSFSNLQTAEIFLSLGRTNEAEILSTAVFDAAFLEVQDNLDNRELVQQLPLFLLNRSVSLLSRSGRNEYAKKLQGLDLPAN